MGSVTIRLKYKLLAMFVAVCLLPIMIVSYINYNEIKDNIANSTKEHLEAIAKLKSYEIEKFFDRKINDIHTMASSPYLIAMIKNSTLNDKAAKRILENNFLNFISVRDMDEVYVFLTDGKKILTVNHGESDIEYVDEAIKAGSQNLFISDMYKAQNGNKSALFTMSEPIVDENNKVIGVVVAEIVFDRFFTQMQDYIGLGKTGETLLAAKKGDSVVFLNPLRHDANASMTRTVKMGTDLALPVQMAVSCKEGSGISVDYRGKKVFAAWRCIKAAKWGIVAKIDASEVYEVSETSKKSILTSSALLVLFLALLYFYIIRNITVPINNTEKRAYTDTLTGLPNRRMLEEVSEQAVDKAKLNNGMLAVLFLDLDGFKAVNDAHGHEVGDKLLKNVAHRLLNCVRQSDVVSRLGGDEFVVLLFDIKNKSDVEGVAKNIIKALNSPFDLDGLEANVGASIGISVFPEHSLESKKLLKKADKAMYEAKNGGKNDYRFAE